jgi:molybdenum cofactor cytidylyltransferase
MIVEGVVIAAGKSSRTYPDNKMLFDINGKTLIERSIESLAPLCSRIIVVTGSNSEKIEEILKNHRNLALVKNDDFEDGMFSSIKAGLKEAKGDRIFFLPGDCPMINKKVFEKMLSIDSDIVIPSYQGRTGHPLLLNRSNAKKISEDRDHISLRTYIANNSPKVVEVDDPGILWDIDTHLDYEEALITLIRRSG